MTNSFWWRYYASGEGSSLVYVDCDFGNDTTGAGTRAKPYKTINHAMRGGNSATTIGTLTIPSTINFRGTCRETILGNHSVTIRGDYWGAAYYDGEGTNSILHTTLMYVLIRNAGTLCDIDYNLTEYSTDVRAACAGVGRAYGAGVADYAGGVYGVCASPVQIENSRLFRGCIGGTTAVHHNIYSKIKKNSKTCGVTFGGNGLSASAKCNNLSVYDLPITEVSTGKSKQSNSFHGYRCIFGKVDFVYEMTDYFYNCLFLADCNWYYVDKSSGNPESNLRLKIEWVKNTALAEPTFVFESRDLQPYYSESGYTGGVMVVTGNFNNIYEVFEALYAAGRTTVNPATYYLSSCVFSAQTSAQVWNNPDGGDFTIKRESDAVIDSINYFGAMAPAVSVPFIGTGDSGSDGVAECWDNRSIDGFLTVQNGALCIDTTSASQEGSIRSKIITTDPTSLQFNGLFAPYDHRTLRGWLLSKLNPFGTKITTSGSYLSESTLYVVKNGTVSFNGNEYQANSCINTTGISAEDLATLPVTWTDEGVYLLTVTDPNIPDTLYCRCRSMIYAYATVGDILKVNVTYLNHHTDKYVKYHGRVIVPGESFICKDANESFAICTSDGTIIPSETTTKIAAIFDDRATIPAGEERIGGSTKWVPMQMFGTYFAIKSEGAIQDISITGYGDVPAGSGNYKAFTQNGGGAAIGGNQSILNQIYLQLAVFATKVSDFEINVE